MTTKPNVFALFSDPCSSTTFQRRIRVSVALLGAVFASGIAAQTWQENFDGPLTPLGDRIVKHPLIVPVNGFGVGGTNAIKVYYEGTEQGSRRVVLLASLPQPAMAYSLSFAVKFCEGFDFAKGGKLHGLGPKKPVSGGKPMIPLGWSARLSFRPGGGLQTYVYHQDQPGKYGQIKVAQDFNFVPGQYYQINMRVTLNEPASAANGRVVVSVDRQKLIEHNGLRLRAQEGADGLIQNFMFSTFHGGGTPDWAPRTVDGAYKVDCAYFDEWVLSP